MPTATDECQFSTVTRVTGDDEQVALSVTSVAGKNRAAVEALERASNIVNAAVTVGITAVAMQVGASPIANRRGLYIQNQGPSSIYIGATGVTTASGVEVALKESLWLALSDSQVVYAIAGTAGQNVRIMEVS